MAIPLANFRCPQVFQGTRVWYAPEWRDELAPLGLGDIRNWRKPVDVPPVSASKIVTACYLIPLAGGRAIYYKRYDYRQVWRDRISFWLRPSRGGVEQYGYGQFRRLGIATPEVIGFGESRVLGTMSAAFIVTREVPDAISLQNFVSAGLPGLDESDRQQKLSAFARRLIDILRKAHADCLFHYDLKWRNILIQEVDGEYYPVLIDCPRAFRSRLRRRYGVTADLSALALEAVVCLTLQQRYRLLAAYLGGSAGPSVRKYWFRRVQRRYERRAS